MNDNSTVAVITVESSEGSRFFGKPTLRPGHLIAAGVTLAILGGLQWLLPGSHVPPLTVVAALTVIQVTSLQRISGELLPLAAIPICALNCVGALGYFFYPAIAKTAFVSGGVRFDQETLATAAPVFAMASAAMWLGAAIVGRGAPARTAGPYQGRTPGTPLLLLGALVPFGLVVLGMGPGALLERPHHLSATGPALANSAGSLSLAVGVLSAGCLALGRRSPRAIAAGWVLVAAYVVLYFALGTRGFCLVPVLMLLAAHVSGHRLGWRPVAAAGLAALFLLQLPLAMRCAVDDNGKRFEPPAGLIPYSARIIDDPSSAFLSPASVAGNVLFSVPQTGTVARSERVTTRTMLTSLNPLPGRFTQWAAINPQLRINPYTPYNGLGELAAFSSLLLIAYCCAAGSVCSAFQRCAARLVGGRMIVAFTVGFGLVAMFSLSFLQYNLRTNTRFVWYLALAALLLHVASRMSRPKLAAHDRVNPAPSAGPRQRIPRPRQPQSRVSGADR